MDPYYVGGAAAVAQVDKFTPANVQVGDTFTITLEDEAGATQSESFVATVATVANVTAGLAAACTASAKSLFAALTWTDTGPGTEVRATAKVAGTPFYATTATVDGGGANTQTLVRAAVTANSGPQDWNTAVNWSTAAVPANGDNAWVDGRAANQVIFGMKQTAVALATLNIGLAMRYAVGQATAALRIGYGSARIGYDPDDGSSPQGSSGIYVDSGTAANALTEVLGSSTTGVTGLAPVVVKSTHAGARIVVYGGTVGIATGKPGDTSTVGAIDVIDGQLSVGAGVTWTTITQSGGKLYTYGGGTTLVNNKGKVNTEGTANIGTVLVGGTANLNHRTAAGASVTTLQLRGGVADFSGDSRDVTVTNFSLRRGRVKLFRSTQLTITTPSIDWDVNTDLTLSAAA